MVEFFGYAQQGTHQAELLRRLLEVERTEVKDPDVTMTGLDSLSRLFSEVLGPGSQARAQQLVKAYVRWVREEGVPGFISLQMLSQTSVTRMAVSQITHYEQVDHHDAGRGTHISWLDRDGNYLVRKSGTVSNTVDEVDALIRQAMQ